MAVTRLSLDGYGATRTGSFANKTWDQIVEAETISLELQENDGFWVDQGIDKAYRSRLETDIRGVGRDISLIFSADSNSILPFVINTVYLSYSLRKWNY